MKDLFHFIDMKGYMTLYDHIRIGNLLGYNEKDIKDFIDTQKEIES